MLKSKIVKVSLFHKYQLRCLSSLKRQTEKEIENYPTTLRKSDIRKYGSSRSFGSVSVTNCQYKTSSTSN